MGGTVRRRGQKWEYVVDLGAERTGRRRQRRKGGFRTRREAAAALAKLTARLADNLDVDDTITVETFLREWFAGKRKLRRSTRAGYQTHLDALIPKIGQIPLTRLRPIHVQRALDELSAEGGRRTNTGTAGMAGSTIHRYRATLRSALTTAVKQRRITYNPASFVELPDGRAPDAEPWSADELGRFLDHAAGDRLGTLYETIALAGLRRGEALGLIWDDVDLDSGVLWLRQTIIDVRCRTMVERPKTRAGQRRVALPQVLVEALANWKRRQHAEREQWGTAWQDTVTLPNAATDQSVELRGLVFTREDGGHIRPEYVTRHFQALAEQAGLRVIRLHGLRHGEASLELAAGVPIEVVSKRLGHSSRTITADIYTHLIGTVEHDAAERASALIPRTRRSCDQPVTTSTGTCTERDRETSVSAGQTGAPPGTRTPNPRIKSPLLCHLS